jgi:hypothetical protein
MARRIVAARSQALLDQGIEAVFRHQVEDVLQEGVEAVGGIDVAVDGGEQRPVGRRRAARVHFGRLRGGVVAIP